MPRQRRRGRARQARAQPLNFSFCPIRIMYFGFLMPLLAASVAMLQPRAFAIECSESPLRTT
jgi:hypothetical protein